MSADLLGDPDPSSSPVPSLGRPGEGRVSVLQVTSWAPVLTIPRWDWPCPCAGLRLLDCEKWDPCWENENTEPFWRDWTLRNHKVRSLDLGVLCVDLYVYSSFTLHTRYFVLGPLTDLSLILFCDNFILCWFQMPFFKKKVEIILCYHWKKYTRPQLTFCQKQWKLRITFWWALPFQFEAATRSELCYCVLCLNILAN